jgi:hypothetical protein
MITGSLFPLKACWNSKTATMNSVPKADFLAKAYIANTQARFYVQADFCRC